MASGDGLDNDRLIAHWGDLVREWQTYRVAFNNAIGILSRELVQLRNAMDKDAALRSTRQAELDGQLKELAARLDAIQENQRFRFQLAMFLAVMGCGIALGWWLL